MPTQPSPWYPGPLSPQQLNLALYSYNGSGYGATGVLFHSHRLIMAESMTQCRAMTVSSAGTWNIFQGTNTTAFNIVDTACLFGLGAEYPGVHAVYHFVPQALGANGVAGTNSAATGGNYLVAHFATGAAAGATPAAIGAGMYVQPGTLPSVFSAQGVVQAHSTGHAGMTMYLDLVNTGTNNNTWQPAGFYADAALTTETPAASSTDTAGFTPRDLWVWASVTTGGSTVSPVPTPQASWTGPLTSSLMNGPSGPVQALTLLNNPPALRVSQALTTSISNNTATPVPFTAHGTIDTYSAFGTATSTYMAPLNGLYLTFPTISFASNATGARYAGLSVTSGTVTTALQGPAYAASGAGAMSVTGVRVLDLNAGDTVKATAFQNSGGALNLGGATWNPRLCMLYLCPYSAGGVNSFTPPATAFHWMAGFPASAIPGLLTEHLGNDLNFLVNRPYFTGYQAHRADRAHRRHMDRDHDRHGGRPDPRVTRRQLRRLECLQQQLRRPRGRLVPRRLRGVRGSAHPGHRVPVGRDQDPHLGGDRTVHEPGLVSDRVLPAHVRARTRRRGGRLLLPERGGDRAAGGAGAELDEQHMEYGVSGSHTQSVHLSMAERIGRGHAFEPGVGRLAHGARRRRLRPRRLGGTPRLAPPPQHLRVPDRVGRQTGTPRPPGHARRPGPAPVHGADDCPGRQRSNTSRYGNQAEWWQFPA